MKHNLPDPVPNDAFSVGIWKKRLPFLLALGAIFCGTGLLFRMLWFDEVLTVNLLLRLPWERIYFAYEIPNNHIVFTFLEKAWIGISTLFLELSYFHFRIPVLISGGIAIWLLSRKLLTRYKLLPTAAVCGAFVCSSVWAMYTTAVRGYMTSFLCIVLSILLMDKWLKSQKVLPGAFLYGILSLLTIGTIPSNLGALAGVTLYYLPDALRRKKWNVLILSALLPVLALVLFYLPILNKFLGCIRLGEGWFSRTNAIYAFYTGACFPVLGLLPFILWGTYQSMCQYDRKWIRLRLVCDILIILMPMAAFLIMKVPPFPRVFFPLLAVWLCIEVRALSFWFKASFCRRKCLLCCIPLILQGIFSLFFFQEGASSGAGDLLYGAGGKGDDFIAPYYARTDFEPNKMIRFLKEKAENGEELSVFASFDSDAPSLLFASRLGGLPEGILHADILNGPKLKDFLSFPGSKYVICADEKDLEELRKRFAFREAVLVKRMGIQGLYAVLK